MTHKLRERHDIANQILLATKWMVESRQKLGKTVMDRYKVVLELKSNWEDAFLEYARLTEDLKTPPRTCHNLTRTLPRTCHNLTQTSPRTCHNLTRTFTPNLSQLNPNFTPDLSQLNPNSSRFLEYLYHESKAKEAAADTASLRSTSGSTRCVGVRNEISLTQVTRMNPRAKLPQQNEENTISYLVLTIKLYSYALNAGSKFISQSLPRLLTLWFSCTMPDAFTKSLSQKALGEVQQLMTDNGRTVGAHVWYTCMPQLVSRAQHTNDQTAGIIKGILIKILLTHPQQSIWHIAGMLHSQNSSRKALFKSIMNEIMSLGSQRADFRADVSVLPQNVTT